MPGATPDDNGDAAFTATLLRRERIQTVLPSNVHIAAEGKQSPIGLREVQQRPSLDMEERQLPFAAEGNPDRDVLRFGPLGVEGRAIVVERLPIDAIAVPVETRCDGLALKVEIVANPVDHRLESARTVRPLRDAVAPVVPRDPLRATYALSIQVVYLANQRMIHRPIVLLAEELRNHDDVIVLQRALIALTLRSHHDAHRWPHKRRRGVEGLGVARLAARSRRPRCALLSRLFNRGPRLGNHRRAWHRVRRRP
mmetsp:Transcript_54534/g.158424  ORF Transcript_54534/g.158424 Transcript_54534/m.158424 type:complete len:254 (+) Transcript_54534:2457-3218(+)